MTDKKLINELKVVLDGGFNLDELRDLCLKLAVDSENLPPTKLAFINELLLTLDRHKKIPDLLKIGQKERNELNWPQLPKEYIETLKQVIETKFDEIPSVAVEIINYFKYLEKNGRCESDDGLLTVLEMLCKDEISSNNFVSLWNIEQVKKKESVTQDINYSGLADQLKHGEVVLFLGKRNSNDMIDKLAQSAQYNDFQGSFSEICEYMEGDNRKTMLRRVDVAVQSGIQFEDGRSHKDLYELLAKIQKPLLLITTAHDDELEGIFRLHNKPFKVLSHICGTGSEGNVLVQDGIGSASKSYTAEGLSALGPLENGISLIYKIRGYFSLLKAMTWSSKTGHLS